MAYCTVDDLMTYFDAGDFELYAEGEGDVAQEAIDEEAAYIDGLLAPSFSLPLESTPALLKKFNAILAVHRLLFRRHKLDMPPYIVKLKDDVDRSLEKIQAGKLLLFAPDELDFNPGTPSVYIAVMRTAERKFPPSELDKMDIV